MQNVAHSSAASADEKRKGKEGAREKENCPAAKREEFVIGREWFQMPKVKARRVPAS